MKIGTINEAMFEARRFIKAVEDARKSLSPEEWRYAQNGTGYRATGAIRRASMDLTRKLADLRQGR